MLGYQTVQLHDVLLLYLITIHYYMLFTLQCSAVVSCSVAAAAVHLTAAQQFSLPLLFLSQYDVAKISAVSRKLVHSGTPLYLTERIAG